jgi:hypothetical protein
VPGARATWWSPWTSSAILGKFGGNRFKQTIATSVSRACSHVHSCFRTMWWGVYLDVTGELRKMHDEKLHNLCSWPNILGVIKLKSMRWVGHVARMGNVKNEYSIFIWRREGEGPLGRLRRTGRIILKWASNTQSVRVWIGFSWLRIGSVTIFCENSNVSYGCHRKYLNQLSDSHLVMKGGCFVELDNLLILFDPK